MRLSDAVMFVTGQETCSLLNPLASKFARKIKGARCK